MYASQPLPRAEDGTAGTELLTFRAVALLVVAALAVRLRRGGFVTRFTAGAARAWRTWPEARLLSIGLPLELLWETAQFPLYDVWHLSGWGYILFALVHCTLGDLLIMLAAYELTAVLNRDRGWYATGSVFLGGLLFMLSGATYTVFSELLNVRVKATWGYTALMPIVPGLGVGGMPLLQWILIPPVLLWLMRKIAAGPTVARPDR